MNGDNNNARSGKVIQALLVDDDKCTLEFVGDLLRELGVMSVTTVMDGDPGPGGLRSCSPQTGADPVRPPHAGTGRLPVHGGLGRAWLSQGGILISGQDARTLKSATLMAQFHELNILATLEKPVDKLDNMGEGIVNISASGMIELFNPAAERIFGYRSEGEE